MRWLALVSIALLGCSEPEPPPTLLEVPAFELTSQAGDAFGSEQLQGEVWIANFIFTRCPTICPLLTSQMKGLTDSLADTPVRFVSFSVDPANDTPAVLTEYAERPVPTIVASTLGADVVQAGALHRALGIVRADPLAFAAAR